MRKNVILVVAFLAVLLCSCEPKKYAYDYNDIDNHVTKVQLINYNNPGAELNSDICADFDFDKMEILDELDEIQRKDFLLSLSQIRFLVYKEHSDSASGVCIRIVYDDGTFEILSYSRVGENINDFIGRYSPSGEATEYLGSFSGEWFFQNLLDSFFIMSSD